MRVKRWPVQRTGAKQTRAAVQGPTASWQLLAASLNLPPSTFWSTLLRRSSACHGIQKDATRQQSNPQERRHRRHTLDAAPPPLLRPPPPYLAQRTEHVNGIVGELELAREDRLLRL